jgi:hypothetical protein
MYPHLLKLFVVMRGLVQNKVISDWMVSNQSEYQSQCRIFKHVYFGPTHRFLDHQTHCGEETNICECGIAFSQSN